MCITNHKLFSLSIMFLKVSRLIVSMLSIFKLFINNCSWQNRILEILVLCSLHFSHTEAAFNIVHFARVGAER